jgi:hypothetical protein
MMLVEQITGAIAARVLGDALGFAAAAPMPVSINPRLHGVMTTEYENSNASAPRKSTQ